MNQSRRGRLRNNRPNHQTQQRAHSATPDWYLNSDQEVTQYNGGVDHSDFHDNVFHPSTFDFYGNSLDLFPDNVPLPSLSYPLNDDENQLSDQARGTNALASPFQLKTPPNMAPLMDDHNVPGGFDIESQNESLNDQGSDALKNEVAQLQLELASVKDSVMSLKSEIQKRSSPISTIENVRDSVANLQSEVGKQSGSMSLIEVVKDDVANIQSKVTEHSSYINEMRSYCKDLSEWCNTCHDSFNKGHQSRAGVAKEDQDTQDQD